MVWQGKNVQVTILHSKAGVAQQVWISNDIGSILIDAGDGALRDILSNNLDLHQLRGILITHGHFDHMGGLYSILCYLRMIGRQELLTIFIPPDCMEVLAIVDDFKRFYQDTIPFIIVCYELQPREKFHSADMEVEPFPMVHCGSIEDKGILDQIPAMGYRITYKNETIAITGDTGTEADLKEFVTGVDLAIIDATYKDIENLDLAYLRKVHLSEKYAEGLGKLAKKHILVHRG